MVVVGPAESQRVLALLLKLSRPVAPLPVNALAFKDYVARQVASNQGQHLVQGGLCVVIALSIVLEEALPGMPKLMRFEQGLDRARLRICPDVAVITTAFDRFEPNLIFD